MAEIRFSELPMFEFANLLEKTREKAIYMKRQMKEEEETLREYPFLSHFDYVLWMGLIGCDEQRRTRRERRIARRCRIITRRVMMPAGPVLAPDKV